MEQLFTTLVNQSPILAVIAGLYYLQRKDYKELVQSTQEENKVREANLNKTISENQKIINKNQEVISNLTNNLSTKVNNIEEDVVDIKHILDKNIR